MNLLVRRSLPVGDYAVVEGPPPYPGPAMLDAAARRELAIRAAESGTVWTTAAFAARAGVSPATAWKDLCALVAERRLVAEGTRRGRRYRLAAD